MKINAGVGLYFFIFDRWQILKLNISSLPVLHIWVRWQEGPMFPPLAPEGDKHCQPLPVPGKSQSAPHTNHNSKPGLSPFHAPQAISDLFDRPVLLSPEISNMSVTKLFIPSCCVWYLQAQYSKQIWSKDPSASAGNNNNKLSAITYFGRLSFTQNWQDF